MVTFVTLIAYLMSSFSSTGAGFNMGPNRFHTYKNALIIMLLRTTISHHAFYKIAMSEIRDKTALTCFNQLKVSHINIMKISFFREPSKRKN